jgi:hypothetical protein
MGPSSRVISTFFTARKLRRKRWICYPPWLTWIRRPQNPPLPSQFSGGKESRYDPTRVHGKFALVLTQRTLQSTTRVKSRLRGMRLKSQAMGSPLVSAPLPQSPSRHESSRLRRACLHPLDALSHASRHEAPRHDEEGEPKQEVSFTDSWEVCLGSDPKNAPVDNKGQVRRACLHPLDALSHASRHEAPRHDV